MSGLDGRYPHSEESTPEGLTNQELEEQLEQQLDECNQKLRVQELEAEQQPWEQEKGLILQGVVAKLIETSREHCAQLEEIRLAVLEISLSNLLNQAHCTLISGPLWDSDIREHCRAADKILKDVAKAAVSGNVQDFVSSQTWAKNFYVNGIHAEMTNNPESAKMLYNRALKREPRYRDLKRVSRFLDRDPLFAKTPHPGDASGDCWRQKRRRTMLKKPGSENRNSWLFQKLTESATTSSGAGIGTIDKVLIEQVFKDKLGANSRAPNQTISLGRGAGTRGYFSSTDTSTTKPAPPSSPQESRARHTAPGVRKVSFDDDAELVDEFSPLSDTPKPSELARPPLPLREETLWRAQLRPLDTGAARTMESPKASVSPPHLPSPLRMVSVNDVGLQDDNSGKAPEEAPKVPWRVD